MNKTLVYAVWMVIQQSIYGTLVTWMKEDHLRKIYETGLFKKIVLQTAKAAGEDGFQRLSIIYFPKDEESWKTYQADHQPQLITEFKEKFVEDLTAEYIKLDRLFGDGEVVFGE